jgi:hypothetical protein
MHMQLSCLHYVLIGDAQSLVNLLNTVRRR